MEGYTSQDNTKEDPFEERVEEYAKQILNISDIKEAKKIIRNIFNSMKEFNASVIEANSEKTNSVKELQNEVKKMFLEYEKYKLLSVSSDCDVEEKIEEFVKENKNSFKENENIFIIKYGNQPFVAVVIIYDINDVNSEINIKTYSSTGTEDIKDTFRRKCDIITPEQIKK